LARLGIDKHFLLEIPNLDRPVMLELTIDYWPYDALAQRIWELWKSLSGYDAAYVALAEELHPTVVTLDRRIQRAPSLTCEVACP
jgi:predicted nucleic acid-binding protein